MDCHVVEGNLQSTSIFSAVIESVNQMVEHRIQFLRELLLFDRLLVPPHVVEVVPVKIVCRCIVRFEFDGTLKFSLRSHKVPIMKFLEPRQMQVSIGESWVSRKRLL